MKTKRIWETVGLVLMISIATFFTGLSVFLLVVGGDFGIFGIIVPALNWYWTWSYWKDIR